MASRYDYLSGALGFLHDARRADVLSLARGDAQLAKKLTDAASMDDGGKALRTLVADMQWGRSPAVPVPEAPAPTGGRSPMPFEQRVARDPEIRRTIEEAGIPAALRAGVDAGDPEAIMAAYRGAGRAEDSIRTLRKPPDQVAAEGIAGQFDRALIPYGTRGPGVAGGMRGPGVPASPSTALIPAPPRQIGGQTRALSIPQRGLTVVDEGIDPSLQRFFDSMDSSPRPRGGVEPRLRRAGGNRAAAAAAAGLVGAGGAAYWASKNKNDVQPEAAASEPPAAKAAEDDAPAVESGGEADLAAENAPPPAIAATPDVPEPTVAQAPQDYSLQARALINRLNDMRRAAGGEVPEAPAMMREINRLLALGNQTRRATMVAAPQDDAGRLYQQAQALIDQVNQMYRQGMSPNSPQVQRVMAQVRQLQSQGDAMRNRRAG